MASAPSSSTTSVWLRSTLPLLGQADQAEQGSLELHPLGHVEQRAARPERRVQRREDVVRGLDGLGQQITLEQLRMVFDRPVQIDENRPARAATHRPGVPGRR